MGRSLPSGSVKVKGDVSGTVRAPGSSLCGAKLGGLLAEWMHE